LRLCPPSARVFHTLEIWQSSFDAPARVVANVGDDMVFGIEAGHRAMEVQWSHSLPARSWR
jgi:hypothetical protein